MDEQPRVLVCALWNDRAVPSVKCACAKCGAEVCVDEKNALLLPEMTIWCLPCAVAEPDDGEFGAGMVSGKVVQGPLVDSAERQFKRLRKRHKKLN